MDFGNKPGPDLILPADEIAPDFKLRASTGAEIHLSILRGAPVILAFYPADWSPVCGDQMTFYNEVLPMFEDFGARLFGISVDGEWCHLAFADARSLRFPLLSDFEPKGAVARALFVIDAQGVIAWSYLSPPGVNPGADDILGAFERIVKKNGQEVLP